MTGPVTYDAWKCIGCRYCMVACPFQIPANDYHDALTPQVRKCQLCCQRIEKGAQPECVATCPQQAMAFGRRSDLLELAREKIKKQPTNYVEHIYGEHEVGGTSWLYLSSVPFEQIGFLKLPSAAPPEVTEAIQHGVFKYGIPPLVLYGLLGGIMALTRPRRPAEVEQAIEAQEDVAAMSDEAPVHTRATPPPLSGSDGGTLLLEAPPLAGGRRTRRAPHAPGQGGRCTRPTLADTPSTTNRCR